MLPSDDAQNPQQSTDIPSEQLPASEGAVQPESVQAQPALDVVETGTPSTDAVVVLETVPEVPLPVTTPTTNPEHPIDKHYTKTLPEPQAQPTPVTLSNHDEPEIFKPLQTTPTAPSATPPITPQAKPTLVTPPNPSAPATPQPTAPRPATQPGQDRVNKLLSTLVSRTGQIFRKWGGQFNNTSQKVNLRMSTYRIDTNKDQFNIFIQRAGNWLREWGRAIGEGLDQWQKNIDASDSAVILTDMLLILLIILLAALIAMIL